MTSWSSTTSFRWHLIGSIFLPTHQLSHLRQADLSWEIGPDLLTFLLRMEDSSDIPVADSFYLKLFIPGVASFVFLWTNDLVRMALLKYLEH